MTAQAHDPTPRSPLPDRNASSIYAALLRVDKDEAAQFDGSGGR